ncbi:thiamine pyrophosphate-binding protein [Micromonospora rosaria]|uniref:thiamine pyrophosphate-binding protein n=1 Tax=Micromonospora rosaria TaxID=47874 RepID=UPI0009FD70D9|nr:thiamine pyrophosphate-binding protein [Micromonospora rosaria]
MTAGPTTAAGEPTTAPASGTTPAPAAGPAWVVLADTLARAGCRAVFGLPADEPGLLDAAEAHPDLTAVAVADQRVAACAAAGHALTSGTPAVLALTTGPAFVNALAGLSEAASLCAPVVVVTTRAPGAQLGRGAFQYVDQAAMADPLLTWYTLVERPDRLVWAVRRAVALAVAGRPGVTVVEVTDEVAREVVDPAGEPVAPARRLVAVPPAADLDRAARLLTGARLPVVLAGGGTRWGDQAAAVVRLAERLHAPIVTTAAGRGVVDERHPLSLGCAGLYATPPVDALLDRADVVLALGSRLEETVRMDWPGLSRAALVQVDLDVRAFDAGVPPALALLGDAGATAAALTDRIAADDVDAVGRADRAALLRDVRAGTTRTVAEQLDRSPVRRALREVAAVYGDRVVWVHENGLHDIWSYHRPALTVAAGATVVCPGEQTMMGFGVAAAIGAATAAPERPVVVLAGDGAVQLSVNALPTAAARRLGITVLMFDNQGFGWPRHLRALSGEPPGPARFPTPVPVLDWVRACGGWAADLAVTPDLGAVLREARAAAGRGELALVRVPVPDTDVPVGVRRLLGPPQDGG